MYIVLYVPNGIEPTGAYEVKTDITGNYSLAYYKGRQAAEAAAQELSGILILPLTDDDQSHRETR